jgi:hypothetical protein
MGVLRAPAVHAKELGCWGVVHTGAPQNAAPKKKWVDVIQIFRGIFI